VILGQRNGPSGASWVRAVAVPPPPTFLARPWSEPLERRRS